MPLAQANRDGFQRVLVAGPVPEILAARFLARRLAKGCARIDVHADVELDVSALRFSRPGEFFAVKSISVAAAARRLSNEFDAENNTPFRLDTSRGPLDPAVCKAAERRVGLDNLVGLMLDI